MPLPSPAANPVFLLADGSFLGLNLGTDLAFRGQ